MSSDRAVILKELDALFASRAESPEEMLAANRRIAELQRELRPAVSSVRVDLNLGSLAETPPELDTDDEAWRGDPYLRFGRECGEDYT